MLAIFNKLFVCFTVIKLEIFVCETLLHFYLFAATFPSVSVILQCF